MHSNALSAPRARADVPGLLLVLLLVLLPALIGLQLAAELVGVNIASGAETRSVVFTTFLLFVAQDRLVAWILLALVPAAALLAGRTRLAALALSGAQARRLTWTFAAIGALGAWVAARWAFHGYLMTLDEYLPRFQAEIFRSGHLMARPPADLASVDWNGQPLGWRFQPLSTYWDDARQLWISSYRPVHAALIAVMPDIGGVNLLNPLLTAVSVLAMADIARWLWPQRTEAPVLAALLLLGSGQVAVMAGSGFAYPAHLAFNLVWLALFLRGARTGRMAPHLAAALVGGLAIGIHQVHVHPLFAFPFWLLLVFGLEGKRIHALPYLIVNLIALPLWMLWPELAVWATTGDAAALPRSLGEVHYLADYLNYSGSVGSGDDGLRGLLLETNLLRFALWLSPALLLLAAVALLRPRGLGALGWAAIASLGLTVTVNQLLMPNQMMTWGARYYHPVIGNLVILALIGWDRLQGAATQGARRLAETAVLLLIAGIVVLIPLRLVQVSAKVGPRAAVQQRIEAIDADVVVIPYILVWFVYDHVRNRPDLSNRPLILATFEGETPPDPTALPGRLKGARLHVVTRQELADFGLPSHTLTEPGGP